MSLLYLIMLYPSAKTQQKMAINVPQKKKLKHLLGTLNGCLQFLIIIHLKLYTKVMQKSLPLKMNTFLSRCFPAKFIGVPLKITDANKSFLN